MGGQFESAVQVLAMAHGCVCVCVCVCAFLSNRCRRFRIKDNDKRWMDALANNIDAKRDRAVSYVIIFEVSFAVSINSCFQIPSSQMAGTQGSG